MSETPAPSRSHRSGLVVVFGLGLIFFVILGFLIFAGKRKDDVPPPRTTELYVLPLRLRVRTQPTSASPVLTTVTRGQKLKLLEDQGNWVRVQTQGGEEGWSERSFLEAAAEFERRKGRTEAIRKLPSLAGEVRSRTTLYAGPGIFYPVVGELQPQTDVRVHTRDHDFFAIEHEGQIVYADVASIDLSAAGAQLEVAESGPVESGGELMTPLELEPAATGSVPTAIAEEQPIQTVPAVPDPIGVYPAVPAGGTQPRVIDKVNPRYPAAAKRANVGGAVVIRAIVRKDGSVDEVEVLKDLPHGLGEAAADAVRQWKFRPGTYRGEPIDVYYTVTVNYRME